MRGFITAPAMAIIFILSGLLVTVDQVEKRRHDKLIKRTEAHRRIDPITGKCRLSETDGEGMRMMFCEDENHWCVFTEVETQCFEKQKPSQVFL